MKNVLVLLTVLLLMIGCLILTACNGICEHTYSNWTTTKVATCTEDGQKERKCTECDQLENQAIKSPGHNYVDGICTECGSTEQN